MDALTRTRLLKFLAPTTSSLDRGALAASRMANRLLKRMGASWADLFEPGRDAAPFGAARANTEGYSQRQQSPRSESHGSGIFGDAPAWTPTLSERIIRAGRLRFFLARIPWPIRVLLGPLTAAGYLSTGQGFRQGHWVSR